MLKLLTVLLSVFVALSSFAAIGGKGHSKEKRPIVFIKKAMRTELFDTLNYPARVDAKIDATILAETDGLVTKVSTSLGHSVKRNTTLLVVKQTDPVFRYAPIAVKSPIAGYVSQLEVSEGARVSKGEKLASVTNPSNIKVTVEVPSQDLDLIRAGMQAQLQVPSSEQMIPLRVKGVSPVIDPATGTATAELEPVDAKQAKCLRPGLISRVSLKANSRKGIDVPEDALIYRDKLTFLNVIKDGIAKRLQVKLGRKSRGRVEIVSGLEDGAEVVERASGYINDGDSVEIQSGDATQGT